MRDWLSSGLASRPIREPDGVRANMAIGNWGVTRVTKYQRRGRRDVDSGAALAEGARFAQSPAARGWAGGRPAGGRRCGEMCSQRLGRALEAEGRKRLGKGWRTAGAVGVSVPAILRRTRVARLCLSESHRGFRGSGSSAEDAKPNSAACTGWWDPGGRLYNGCSKPERLLRRRIVYLPLCGHALLLPHKQRVAQHPPRRPPPLLMEPLLFDCTSSYSDASTPRTPSPRTSLADDEMHHPFQSSPHYKTSIDLAPPRYIFDPHHDEHGIPPETHTLEAAHMWSAPYPGSYNPPGSRGSLLDELYEPELPEHHHHIPHESYIDHRLRQQTHWGGMPQSAHIDVPLGHGMRHAHDIAMQRRNTFPYVRQDRAEMMYTPPPPFMGSDHDSMSGSPYGSRPSTVYSEPLSMDNSPHLAMCEPLPHAMDEPFAHTVPSPHMPYHDFGIKTEEPTPVIVPSQTGYRPGSGGMHPLPCLAPHNGLLVQHTDDAASKETQYLRRRCFNCHTTEPPSWRRSTLNPGKIVCNKCGLYERTHLRPRPLRFDELRAGSKTRKAPKAPGSSPKAGKVPAMVKKEPREGSEMDNGGMPPQMPRRSSVSSSAGSSVGASSDWDDNGTSQRIFCAPVAVLNFGMFMQFPYIPQAPLRRLPWARLPRSRTPCATPTRSPRHWPVQTAASGCRTRHSTTSSPSSPARSSMRRASRRRCRCISPGTSRRATSTGEGRSRRRTICSGDPWTSPSPRSPAGSRCPPSTCPRRRRTRLCANRIALIFIGHLETPSCAAAYLFDPLLCRSLIAPLFLALYTLFPSETRYLQNGHTLTRTRICRHVCGTSSRRSKAKRLVPCTDHPLIRPGAHCIIHLALHRCVSHSHPVLGVIVGCVSSYFLLLIGSCLLSRVYYWRAVWLDRRAVMYIFNLIVVQCPTLIFACLVCNRSV